jgi:hypothetical protein
MVSNLEIYTPKSLRRYIPKWNEERSFDFLSYYICFKNWFCYGTKSLEKQYVLEIADLFSLTHARIDHPLKQGFDFWSTVPINIFRYKMLSDGQWDHLKYPCPEDNQPGYVVEGAYWTNGFYYQVLLEGYVNEDYLNNLVELNLFMDERSHQLYAYPENYTMVKDHITTYFPELS